MQLFPLYFIESALVTEKDHEAMKRSLADSRTGFGLLQLHIISAK